MAIDYEFREKVDKDFKEISGFLLNYFDKNPDRAKENKSFIKKLYSVLNHDTELNPLDYKNAC